MKPQKLNIHGVVLLDKPTGLSSNRALQKVKHAFSAKKAGHTGSLDPLATGLLPICMGQATKVSEYLLHSEKKYTTTIKFGETTDTYDSEGEVVERGDVNFTDEQFEQALEKFRGAIQQVPPMFSALKKDGQPLYKLARKGEHIERKARSMFVHSLSGRRLSADVAELEVQCSSGFYIRSLAHDLGQTLACGAHVTALRRIAIKAISVDQAVSLDELLSSENLADFVLPIDSLIDHLPRVNILESEATALERGQRPNSTLHQAAELARFYTDERGLFAIGEINQDGGMNTRKIFVCD